MTPGMKEILKTTVDANNDGVVTIYELNQFFEDSFCNENCLQELIEGHYNLIK